MRDILLWRELMADRPSWTDGELAVQLEELSAAEYEQRIPFFGALGPLISHPEPRIRAGALRVLSGAGGYPALLRLVGGLDDTAESVRRAAVEALAVSARKDPARFAHALFHPDPSVRSIALAAPLPEKIRPFSFYLLRDEQVRREAAACLSESSIELVKDKLPLLAAMAREDEVYLNLLKDLFRKAGVRNSLQSLGYWEVKDQAKEVLRAARAGDLAALGASGEKVSEVLYYFLDLFWNVLAPTPLERGKGEGIWEDLAEFVRPTAPPGRCESVAAILVQLALTRGGWTPAAAALAALAYPLFLDFPGVPLSLRRGAVESLYHYGRRWGGGRLTRFAPSLQLKEFLSAGICRHPSGNLDLRVLGGVLGYLFAGNPYKALLEVLDPGESLVSDGDRIGDLWSFLSLPDDSPEAGKLFIKIRESLESIREKRDSPEIRALIVRATPTDQIKSVEFLKTIDSREAVELFSEIAGFRRETGMGLSENREHRLANILAPAIGGSGFPAFLKEYLDPSTFQRETIGKMILENLAAALPEKKLLRAVTDLDHPRLRNFLELIPGCSGFPYRKEEGLILALLSHPDPGIRGWAEERRPPPRTPPPPEKSSWAGSRKAWLVRRLTPAQKRLISACDEKDLPAAVRPCLGHPVQGLTAALARRAKPNHPSLETTCALVLSYDRLEQVGRELARFGDEGRGFSARVHEFIRDRYLYQKLPLLAHAVLSRWEKHCFDWRDIVESSKGGLAGLLKALPGFDSRILRDEMWAAAERLIGIWRWREPGKFPGRCGNDLLEALEEGVFSPEGYRAAAILMKIREAGVKPGKIAGIRRRILPRFTELDERARRAFRFWIDSRGLEIADGPGAVDSPPSESGPSSVEEIGRLTDIDLLSRLCRGENPGFASAAALRLVELEDAGLSALVSVIRAEPVVPAIEQVCETVTLWPDGAEVEELRLSLKREELSPEAQIFAALALAQRGDPELRRSALAAPFREAERVWFKLRHWDALLAAGFSREELAVNLSACPQAGAYTPAIQFVLEQKSSRLSLRQAAADFLEAGSDRYRALRLQAAEWLFRRGDHRGLPLLLEDACGKKTLFDKDRDLSGLLKKLAPEELRLYVHAELWRGGVCLDYSNPVWPVIGESPLAEELARSVLESSNKNPVCAMAMELLGKIARSPARSRLLRRLGEVCVWGITEARILADREFQIRMLSGRNLGVTDLRTSVIGASPLPLLRKAPSGREIVEGLILHELGHHLYHADPVSAAVQKKAWEERLAGLLNLVRDEHLERRLRSRNQRYGHRFKKLSAYAFLHSDREWNFKLILKTLGPAAGPLLTAVRLGVSREDGCVLVEQGQVLQELERRGLAFARFVRALRMGLGNRFGDPKVAEALRLFRGRFRDSTPGKMLEIARRLREIFGKEAELVELMFRGAMIAGGEAETRILGEGITERELQREIRKILEEQSRREKNVSPSGGRRKTGESVDRFINLDPEEDFQLINQVVRVPYDRGKYLSSVRRLKGHPARMRRYFEKLGLAPVNQRMRIRGLRLDRTRLLAAVTRSDPRILISRRLEPRSDLFLGLLVDCSGSMAINNRIRQARLFAVLLAEAAREVPNIDVRIFGFTDDTIFDAGTAARCSAPALESGGGNNDAAALWHAAREALRSRRKARLLVMISDGSPTECSVAALRALVSRLQSRMGIACAQVAVRKLDEICFPHYLEVLDRDPGRAVAEFGRIVVRLVNHTIRGRG